MHIECTYILIPEVLVLSLGEGKLRGDRLPPFQLPSSRMNFTHFYVLNDFVYDDWTF